MIGLGGRTSWLVRSVVGGWALALTAASGIAACAGEGPAGQQVPSSAPVAGAAPSAGDEAEAARKARFAALLANHSFLEMMTFRVARELGLEGLEPLLFEILKDGEGAPRIREAVKLNAAAVEDLIVRGEWVPQDLKEWKWVTLTALLEELGGALPNSIERSMHLENSPTRYMAAGLLFTEEEPLAEMMAEGFAHTDPRNRAFTAAAVGANGHGRYMPDLRELMADPHPWVRANATASLIRWGDEAAAQKGADLFAQLGDAAKRQEGSLLLEALERAAPDERVIGFVRDLQGAVQGQEGAAVDAILVLHGGATDTARLRAVLPTLSIFAPEVSRGVRALSSRLGPEDVAVMSTLFSREYSEGVGLELAVGLAKAGSLEVEPLLRTAALDLPWNQALIAAGCASAVYGDGVLVRWACEAPKATPAEWIRRLGWAHGAFHGGAAGLSQEARETLAAAPAGRLELFEQGARIGAMAAR